MGGRGSSSSFARMGEWGKEGHSEKRWEMCPRSPLLNATSQSLWGGERTCILLGWVWERRRRERPPSEAQSGYGGRGERDKKEEEEVLFLSSFP